MYTFRSLLHCLSYHAGHAFTFSRTKRLTSLLLIIAMPGLAQANPVTTPEVPATQTQANGENSKQEEEPRQWYQAEVIVFAYRVADNELEETWPDVTDLDLFFPEKMVNFLYEPATELSPTTGFDPLASNGLSIHASSPEGDQATAKASPPLHRVDASVLEMESVAQSLSRNYQYRVLNHFAWKQPDLSESESYAIKVVGGDQFGDGHFELDGTVKLHVSRYLHIDANLWLKEFAPRIEIEGESSMENSAMMIPMDSIGEDIAHDNLTAENANDPESVHLDLVEDGMSDVEKEEAKPLHLSEQPGWAPEGYEIVRTVQLRESRRMRSEELHYLDHPLLGLMIKVVKTEAPEVEETGAVAAASTPL